MTVSVARDASGEEHRAHDLVGQRLAEERRRDPGVDLGPLAGVEVGQDLDRRADHDRRLLQPFSGCVPHRPLEEAVDELEIGLDERHRRGRLGSHGAQRGNADREVADARRIPLQDVEPAGRRVAAEELAADRRGQQGAARHLELVGLAGRREDPEIDLGRAVGGAWGPADDRDLVDDHAAAAQCGAEPVRPGGEDHDQDRHRHPRPLAPVEPAQDEVVDRSDQQDVRPEEQEQPADRRQGERRQLRDGTDQLAVVGEDLAGRGPLRKEPPPEVLGGARLGDPRCGGSKPMIVTEPAAVGSLGRDDPVADRGKGTSADEVARQGHDVGRVLGQLAEETGERLGSGIGRRQRTVGEDRVGERREGRGSGGPARDHEPPATRQPALERGKLLRLEEVRVDVLPDQPVDGAPRLDTRRQVGRRQRERDRRLLLLVGQEAQTRDDALRSLGDDAHDQLGRVADRVLGTGRRDLVVALDEVDLDLAPEARRLGVQEVDLVRAGGQVDGRPVLRPALRAAVESEFAGDRGSVVAQVNLDGHPRAGPGVTAEQDSRLHRRRVAVGCSHRGRQCREPDETRTGTRSRRATMLLLWDGRRTLTPLTVVGR